MKTQKKGFSGIAQRRSSQEQLTEKDKTDKDKKEKRRVALSLILLSIWYTMDKCICFGLLDVSLKMKT